MSTSRTSKIVFHILGIVLLTYPFYWVHSNPNRISDSHGGQMQMFTILTLSLTYLACWVSLLSDYFPRNAFIKSAKRTLLLIACPCETLVSTLYWPIKLYDPTLLAPPEQLAMFPLSADLSMHAIPTILLLIETFVFSEAIETSNVKAALAYAIYGTGYYFWTERNAKLNSWYPYPMFDLMTTNQRIATFVGATSVAFVSFLLLKTLYAAIHGEPKSMQPTDKALKKKFK